MKVEILCLWNQIVFFPVSLGFCVSVLLQQNRLVIVNKSITYEVKYIETLYLACILFVSPAKHSGT